MEEVMSPFDVLPVMLARIDLSQCVTSHNRSFRQWLGLEANQIDGRALKDVFPGDAYADIEGPLAVAFAGKNIHAERTMVNSNGGLLRLLALYLPHVGDSGQVQGVFMMLTDITRPQDARVTAASVSAPERIPVAAVGRSAEHRMYVSAMAKELTGWDDSAAQLRTAIESDEFCLYCQPVIGLGPASESMLFHEILLRLTEEEKGLMAPGSFLPIAEQNGLLPELDRWVVRNLLGWILGNNVRRRSVYSINVAAETLIDADFPLYVREQLLAAGIPGSIICFEFTETAASQWTQETLRFITQLKLAGCRFSLTGFGRNIVSFALLKKLPVDWLKIDSSMIWGLLRNPVDLARVKAINEVAHKMRIRTIAECVEDDETIAKLRELGVDFAQGFGISRPKPLYELTQTARQ